MRKYTRLDKREQSVANAIREAVEQHFGEYDNDAVKLSLALQMIAQAMKTDSIDRHVACAQVAIGLLISGGYLLEHPTKKMPTL